MRESGRVVAIEDDALWVETIRQSSCGSCAAQKGCGQGLLNKIGDGKRNHLRVLLGDVPASRFQLDSEVEFSVPEHVLLRGAMLVYLLPLIAMIAGMGVAHALFVSDKLAALGALLGFVGGMLLVRVHHWVIRDRLDYQPTVVEPAVAPTVAQSPSVAAPRA
ncbi:SoxR reducing system RseC family protein [Litorivivens lipolytica]|nr:SoxR reducing system RseC family protein [Litorivivens lipolytica]